MNTETLKPEEEKLDVPAVARECGRDPTAVRRWISKGIRVGKTLVKLEPVIVTGNRDTVTRGTLAKFLAECRRAKYGDGDKPKRPARRFHAC